MDVISNFDKDGTMSKWTLSGKTGKNIMWTNDTCKGRCASPKAGGIRFCFHHNGEWKESHLYYRFDKWFYGETMFLIREMLETVRENENTI